LQRNLFWPFFLHWISNTSLGSGVGEGWEEALRRPPLPKFFLKATPQGYEILQATFWEQLLGKINKFWKILIRISELTLDNFVLTNHLRFFPILYDPPLQNYYSQNLMLDTKTVKNNSKIITLLLYSKSMKLAVSQLTLYGFTFTNWSKIKAGVFSMLG
jgi:hypothetical protein